MIHVGLDLHRCNSLLVAISDEGEVFPSRRIHHDNLQELWQYLDQFGQQPLRVVFESTGNSRWMYRLLSERPGVEPVQVSPHKVRIIAESLAKSDKVDADALAMLSLKDALPRSWVPTEDVEELRELTRYRAALVHRRTQAKNSVNSVLTRCGLLRPHADIFGTRGRKWLELIELPAPMRHQVDGWLAQLDSIGQCIALVEKELFSRLLSGPRWQRDAELLMSMPGVGKLTALTILAELGDYRRFGRRSQVAAYAGLVPKSRRSDQTVRYGRLTRRGPVALRTILVEVAVTAARQSTRYGRLYDKLKAAGRPNAGKAAVARQMLEDAWTILMKQQAYCETGNVQIPTSARAG